MKNFLLYFKMSQEIFKIYSFFYCKNTWSFFTYCFYNADWRQINEQKNITFLPILMTLIKTSSTLNFFFFCFYILSWRIFYSVYFIFFFCIFAKVFKSHLASLTQAIYKCKIYISLASDIVKFEFILYQLFLHRNAQAS